MTGCRVLIGPAHLAARAAGARVEVAVGVGVARVVRSALAHRVAETFISSCVFLTGKKIFATVHLPEAVQSALTPQGLVEQGSSRHSLNGSPT